MAHMKKSSDLKGASDRDAMLCAMLLYVVFVNPLVLVLSRQPGLSVGGETYKISAYVDDMAVVTDVTPRLMRTIADILDSFCRATNSVLNKVKTKSLKIGRWGSREENLVERASKWINPSTEVELLGLIWKPTIGETVEANTVRLQSKANSEIGV